MNERERSGEQPNPPRSDPGVSRADRIVDWTLRVALALALLIAGTMKFVGAPSIVDEFRRIGLGQWFRYVTGTLEVIGSVGLFAPRWHRHAAALLAAVMIGALVTNVVVLQRPPVLPGVLLTMALGIVFVRVIRRAWAWGIGAGSLVVGVLRFFAIAAIPNMRSPEYLHGCVHLVTGVLFWWIAARTSEPRLRAGEALLGLFYLAFACFGWLGPVKFEDNFMHLGIGLVSIALAGLVGMRAAVEALRSKDRPAAART